MEWKEEYEIGVALVDAQHKELFAAVTDFLMVVSLNDPWEKKLDKIYETLDFMKNYVVRHFKAEQALQLKVGYPEYESHKQIHDNFIAYVLRFESEFGKDTSQVGLVQQFAGKLFTWLIHHVIVEDNKIGVFVKQVSEVEQQTMATSISYAIIEILTSMANMEVRSVEAPEQPDGDTGFLNIEVGIIGDLTGSVIYRFPSSMALGIVRHLSGIDCAGIDPMVVSAVSELSNIMTGRISALLYRQNFNCDITTPRKMASFSPGDYAGYTHRVLHTQAGGLHVYYGFAEPYTEGANGVG